MSVAAGNDDPDGGGERWLMRLCANTGWVTRTCCWKKLSLSSVCSEWTSGGVFFVLVVFAFVSVGLFVGVVAAVVVGWCGWCGWCGWARGLSAVVCLCFCVSVWVWLGVVWHLIFLPVLLIGCMGVR